MPDRFATAVWDNPAAMRQCRAFFAKCDTPLLLLVLEVWRGFSAISQSAYPTSLTVAMTKGALFASSITLSTNIYWRNRCRVDQLSDLRPRTIPAAYRGSLDPGCRGDRPTALADLDPADLSAVH
jgi:hypothetical protein